MTTETATEAMMEFHLTRRDLEFLRRSFSGEFLTYLGHAAQGGLRAGRETEHLEYMEGLNARLEAAIAAARPETSLTPARGTS